MGIFLVGSLVQTMILVNNENYPFPSWQGTLLAFAAMAFAYVGNVYGNRILPYWQTAVFAIHIGGFLGYVVPIWMNAPKASHQQVWASFENEGGWSSIGLAVLVGQLSGISQQVGIDTAAHMSEEVKDAASSIPRTMMAVYFINMGFILLSVVTVAYHIPDLDAALNDTTTYPALYVLKQSMSVGWVTVMLVIMLVVNMASNIVYLAAVTRDLFAFARDKGVPFSGWLATIHPKRQIPVNATIFSCCTALLLALIYIGSPVAFYAITSLATVSLLQCYCLSIGCHLWRRINKPETLPPAKFPLGRFGIPLNVAAVVYALYSFFWAMWPTTYPVTASGFNWASPIFVAALIGAMIYFVFKARHTYVGPVREVEGRKEHFG
ncbi:hypothetical protein LTR53_013159 [Teratosphaeriaceae sp. CCFEE 6253]|nr:hypothetical protein LTR53_013159 [Teratosphaeriaceae sp. CCFEE 6253]